MNRRALPVRGDIWLVDFDPTKGREQRGLRPAVVVSADRFSQGPAELVIVLPVTTTDRRIASHVPVKSHDSGLDRDSWILCEQVRCVSRLRLSRRVGRVPAEALERVSLLLRVLLEL